MPIIMGAVVGEAHRRVDIHAEVLDARNHSFYGAV
jgi:hypothetical protein